MTYGNAQPNTAQLADMANFYYGEYCAQDHLLERPSLHLRRLAKRLGLRPGQKVLDVAWRYGDWLLAATECGCGVASIELPDRAPAPNRMLGVNERESRYSLLAPTYDTPSR